MNTIATRLDDVRQCIRSAATKYGRPNHSIQLLAVSKTRPAEDIRSAIEAGQHSFGENYLQEAAEKIQQLADAQAEWHFIGRIQSNKTKIIATHFDWVHGLCSFKHAQRLNDQRPDKLPPLNVCLQINLSNEQSKAGITPAEAAELAGLIHALPRLHLKGLMTLPAPAETLLQQRQPFQALRELRDQIKTDTLPLDTLSMGMSGDLEAAIAEGATIVRIGTAIFGPRNHRK
ncbi:MAG: YggS family pyridoxal phosphate-dependent enzyme [Candidatus Polarisedimenticolaceae bacterium]|nr:YggS family pyridoxal phosphate-dependent enzyme [Candidatus Polarisedimenticolaceae bacterium]